MSIPQPEVPTTQRLVKATLLSLLVAAAILVVAVLPAEYGIDPTGIGSRLGLDALASTEVGDAEDLSSPAPSPSPALSPSPSPDKADAPEAIAAEPGLDAVGQPIQPIDSTPVSKRSDGFRSDEMNITLAPGKGAEIKAEMQAEAGFVFHWTASAPVAVDMHGDRKDAKDGEYTSYWIEASLDHGSGSFTAPFEGSHGWYWLNRSDAPVTVKLRVTGFQNKLFRPGHE